MEKIRSNINSENQEKEEEKFQKFQEVKKKFLGIGDDFKGHLSQEEIEKIKKNYPRRWDEMKDKSDSQFVGNPSSVEELAEAKKIATVISPENLKKRREWRDAILNNFAELADLTEKYGEGDKWDSDSPVVDAWVVLRAKQLAEKPEFSKFRKVVEGLLNERERTYEGMHIGVYLLKTLIKLAPISLEETVEQLKKIDHSRDEKKILDKAVLSLALEEHSNNPDFKNGFTENTQKFLELLAFAQNLHNEVGIKHMEGGGRFELLLDGRSIIMLQGEDREADYDPPYIRSAQLKSEKFNEHFTTFGLKAEVANELPEYSWQHGPYHYVDLTEFRDELKNKLSPESKQRLQSLVDIIEQKEKDRQDRIKRAEEQKRQEEISQTMRKLSEQHGLEISENDLRFIAEFLYERAQAEKPVKIESVKKEGDYVIIAERNFDTFVTRSTVTDYVFRRVFVFHLPTKRVAVSEKDKGLFRSTEKGKTGFDVNAEIAQVDVREDRIKVLFYDGGRQVVRRADFAEVVNMDPDIKKQIDQQIQEELQSLKKSRRNLQIPIPFGSGPTRYRSADAGIANIEYGKDRAIVTLWEEIDYRAQGPYMYETQKRINEYEVTPESITLLSSKTLDYGE